MRKLIVMLVALGLGVALAPPASAGQGTGNPVLGVSASSLPATKSSTVTVTGTDYLVPPHAPGTDVFGGVYVFFGWVRPGPGWGPSARNSSNNDGNFGSTYSYRGDGGDGGTRDDGSGAMRFVSFTAGGISGDAASTHMDDNGNWTTTMTIPGSRYEYTDPITSATHAVDCQKVQCGVYTIGAHGKASATNEKFAPITFVTPPTTPTTRPRTTVPPTVPTGPAGGVDPAPPTTAKGQLKGGSKATTAPTTRGSSTTASSPPTSADSSGDESRRAGGTAIDSDRVALSRSPEPSDQSTMWVVVVALVAIALAATGGAVFLRRRRA